MYFIASIDMTSIADGLSSDIQAAIVIGLGVFALTFGVYCVKKAFMTAAADGPVTGFYDSSDELHTRAEFDSDEEFEAAMESALSDYGGYEEEGAADFDDGWDGSMLGDQVFEFDEDEIDPDDPDVLAMEEACQSAADDMRFPLGVYSCETPEDFEEYQAWKESRGE